MGKVFQNNGDCNRKMFALLIDVVFHQRSEGGVKEGSEAERN